LNSVHPPANSLLVKDDVELHPDSNIWLTMKARMEAEKRCKINDLFFNLLLIWYSICLLSLSIFSVEIAALIQTVDLDRLSIFLSACVLVLSVLSWSFKLSESAHLFRQCYLELQELLAQTDLPCTKNTKYMNILKKYPNHNTIDMDSVLNDRILKRRQKLYSRAGIIAWRWHNIFFFYARMFAKYVMMLVLVLVPILVPILL
jgi:hypothetical protein